MKSKNESQLWEVYYKCEKGELHKKNNLLCQDRIAYRQHGESKQAIVLVDGRGSNNLNIIVGEELAENIAGFLVDNFNEIIYLLREREKESLKKAFLVEQKRLIYRLSEEYNLEISDVKFTVMCICIDHDEKVFCGIHLGDGIITFLRDDKLQSLSEPVNGLLKNQTYFITTEGSDKKLKVFYAKLEDDIDEISLVSDGVYHNKAFDLNELLCCIDEFINNTNKIKNEDDRSIIKLRRKKECQSKVRKEQLQVEKVNLLR